MKPIDSTTNKTDLMNTQITAHVRKKYILFKYTFMKTKYTQERKAEYQKNLIQYL